METTQVLVVGAGPTGLVLAAELARHGVRCRIVEQSLAPSDRSKALAIHARTLEVLGDLGCADALIRAGRKVHALDAHADGRRIVQVGFDDLDSPYSFVLVLPQPETERILAEHLERAGVAVERGTQLVSFTQESGSVVATLDHRGREERVEAAFVVGCDGAHSTVRTALGLPFEGAEYEEQFTLADVALTGDLTSDELHAFLHVDGGLLAVPLPRDGRWRVVASFSGRGAAVDPAEPTLEDVQRLFDTRAGGRARVSDPEWMATFRVHRRLVSTYRKGRAFLAGDAAHIHSPIGGQGMNTGIQDAYNLAWKLGLVLRGKSPDALLDSYTAERRPVAQLTLFETDLAMRAIALQNPVARALEMELASLLTSIDAVRERLARQVSELAVSYRKSPIVGEKRGSLFDVSLSPNRATEKASVKEWAEFGAGPAPGERAPDAEVGPPGARERLFDRLRGTTHTLFLFDGAAATAAGYDTLEAIARRVRERAGDLVRVLVVVPGEEIPAAVADRFGPALLRDPRGEAHHRYGAGAECLYLVRPDGYVGFRSQPADGGALQAHLDRILGK